MPIHIQGAREHNLQGIDVEIGQGLTVVTGVSGSGKTSLVFDTLYHEARRRFLDIFSVGSAPRLVPARVDSITGLGPAIAVGQNLLNRNPASTLASASGLHPFLRLLFARFGRRTCPRCGADYQVFNEDEIVEHLVARSQAQHQLLRLLAPLLRGVPGSHGLLLHALAERFGLDDLRLDGFSWNGELPNPSLPHDLDVYVIKLEAESPPLVVRKALREVLALGVNAVVAASPEYEETLVCAPVCLACGTWFREINPVQFHQTCPHCQGSGCSHCAGTGLPPEAAAVRWQNLRFPEILALRVEEARERFSSSSSRLALPAPRLLEEIQTRLDCLERVGLGYLSLDRPSPTLSRGEAQRVRLAVALVSRLEDMLHVLDEPTIGQHPADVQKLVRSFAQLPGPVIFVEHDRTAAALADQAIDIGPGPGPAGGQVVFNGSPAGLWQADTATGRFFSRRQRVSLRKQVPPPAHFLTIKNASLRNLSHIDVSIPVGQLTVVSGVSGSGKSTLVEGVLYASLNAPHGQPVGCQGIEGPLLKPVIVDQSPIGRNPRSNPATYTKLADLIRDLFASATGLSPSHFSFNRPDGACPTCAGLGAVEAAMRYLPSTWVTCSDCGGQRFSEEVLEAKVAFGAALYSIAGFLDQTINQARPLIAVDNHLTLAARESALRILDALEDIGLGYLTLGQPSPTLSGGEAQRVKLAKYLSLKSLNRQLLILDEPSTGLHPQDLEGLLRVFDRLVHAGATLVVVEHNTDIIRRAGWVIDLGPGAGPRGGKLIYAGPPQGLLETAESITGLALRSEDSFIPGRDKVRQTIDHPPVISIRGARAHNLKNLDVDFPKASLTVVTGVSGSGKSSLVSDVLETEARRRFLETLSLYERQGVSEGPQADVDTVKGLGVAVSITPEKVAYARRATVGTASELIYHLAVLLSTTGQRACLSCGYASMERNGELVSGWTCPNCAANAPEKAALARPQHFIATTYAAACVKCNGVGSLVIPRPEKLIIHPEKPLVEGAMYSPGFFPNGYLGKPFNHGYYQVLALGQRYGFDPHTTPWRDMTHAAQQAFLFGDPEPMQVTAYGHTGLARSGPVTFPGFYGFLRDWDVGGTYSANEPCPQCAGARLRPEFLAVTLDGNNVYALSQMPLVRLEEILTRFALPAGLPSSVSSSLASARRRLGFLCQVGLGYLHLDQVAGTLSAGEVQRIRLAGLLGSGLTSLTLLLDEPTRGLHPSEVEALVEALLTLRDEGNTVIVVEHDPQVIQRADWLIDVGPGAGDSGGQIVAQGTPVQAAQAATLTGAWLRGERQPTLRLPRRQPQDWLVIQGARTTNLQNLTARLPLGVLAGVCGVSGSGKSSLVIDTLGRALAPRRQTTSVAYEPVDPGEHDRIDGSPARTLIVDQSKAGLTNPAAALGLVLPLRSLYTASPEARALGLGDEQFSARCSTCGGSGVIKFDMAFLPDLHVPCESCQGTGFLPEAWQVRLKGVALPELNALTIDQVFDLFGEDPRLERPLQAARQVGLGYLVLRQPGYSLSGGEAQRLKIAQELMRKESPGTLYILDEPTVGQHLEDVRRLIMVLYRLVESGGSVLVVEHHIHLLAACDWLVELGPGGGPQGGQIIAEGTPETLAQSLTPTAPYLRQVLEDLRQ